MKRPFCIYLLCFILLANNAFAQKEIGLSLTINNEVVDTVYADEAILLTLTVLNQAAQNSILWNLANDRRADELKHMLLQNKISQQKYDDEKKEIEKTRMKFIVLTLGSDEKPWYNLLKWECSNKNTRGAVLLKPDLLPNPGTDKSLQLDGQAYYQVVFGISPEKTGHILPATYTITVTLNNATSTPVTLTVLNTKMPPLIANNEKMLLQSGYYYWHAGEASKAITLADKIVSKNSQSIEGILLRGDACILLKRYADALKDYQLALKIFYTDASGNTEPPEVILNTIDWLKEQL